MFTEEHRRTVWDQVRQHDLLAFAKFLSPELLTTAAVSVSHAGWTCVCDGQSAPLV